MNITPIIVGLFGLICLFRPQAAIIFLGAVATVPVASVYNDGRIRLWIYYGLALFICLALMLRLMRISRPLLLNSLRVFSPILAGVVLVVIGSMSLPFFFSGTQVFLARGGMDFASTDELYPLTFTISNFAQSAYLVINALVLFFLVLDFDEEGFTRRLRFALTIFFSFGLIFVGWQVLSLKYGTWFPESFVHGDDYDSAYALWRLVLGYRINGSFAEPADLGMFSGACLGYGFGVYFFMKKKVFGGFFIMGGVAAALLSGSTTAYIAMAGAILALFLCWKSIRVSLVEIALICIVLAVAIWYLLEKSQIGQSFASLVLDKDQSASFSNRLFSVKYSFDLFCQTYGLGVGLGSNRPSSMLALLISCLGIFSIPVLWFLFVSPFSLLNLKNPVYRSLYCAYAAVCASVLTAIPDLSQIAFVFITTCTLAVLLRSRIYKNMNSGIELNRGSF